MIARVMRERTDRRGGWWEGDEEGDGGESENGVEKENDAKKHDSGDEMGGLEQTE